MSSKKDYLKIIRHSNANKQKTCQIGQIFEKWKDIRPTSVGMFENDILLTSQPLDGASPSQPGGGPPNFLCPVVTSKV